MAQKSPETVRLSKEGEAAFEKLLAALKLQSPVIVSRNAAFNYAVIEVAKMIDAKGKRRSDEIDLDRFEVRLRGLPPLADDDE